jgi:hypothetical protein
LGRKVGVGGAEERSAVQCGAGEGEDFDGGREGVALDRHLTASSGKWDVQVMLQSRTVLGTQAAREGAAQERWLLAAGRESLPSPSTSRNHGGPENIDAAEQLYFLSLVAIQFTRETVQQFCPQIAPRDGLPP